jgi:hypothetical protein
MANELKLNRAELLHFYKDGDEVIIDLPFTVHDVTGTEYLDTVLSIGTSAETVGKGDIGTWGAVYLENKDTSNYVEVGDDADNPSIKLYASGSGVNWCLVPWGATNISLKANTAACRVRVVGIEL